MILTQTRFPSPQAHLMRFQLACTKQGNIHTLVWCMAAVESGFIPCPWRGSGVLDWALASQHCSLDEPIITSSFSLSSSNFFSAQSRFPDLIGQSISLYFLSTPLLELMQWHLHHVYPNIFRITAICYPRTRCSLNCSRGSYCVTSTPKVTLPPGIQTHT